MSILTPVRDDQSAPRGLSTSRRTGFRAGPPALGPVRPGCSHLFYVALPRRGSGNGHPRPGNGDAALLAEHPAGSASNGISAEPSDRGPPRLPAASPSAAHGSGRPRLALPYELSRYHRGDFGTLLENARIAPFAFLERSAAALVAAGPLTSSMLTFRILLARMPRNLSPLSTVPANQCAGLCDLHGLRKPTNPVFHAHIPNE